jgi:cyclase
LGRPEDFAAFYYEAGADELLYMDVVASLYQRNSLFDMVTKTARGIYIPLTVGGGLRTIDDIREMLRSGADKIAINTAALNRPELIKEAAQRFGSSTIVVSIEAISKSDGTYEAYTNYGRDSTGKDAVAWAIQAAKLGAGELLVTSIDAEGTGKGYDLELTRRIAEAVPIPVIACGGAGSVKDICDVISQGKADAVSAASIFQYYCFARFQYEEQRFSNEGNTEFLSTNRISTRLSGMTVQQVKQGMADRNIACRPV